MIKIQPILQRCDYDCGSAVMDCVIRYWGVRTSVAVLNLSHPITGTSPDVIEAVLRKAGLRIISGPMTVIDLQNHCRLERPILCPVTTDDGVGHWVCVIGVQRGRVYFHDPLVGQRSLKVADWDAGWRDTSHSGHEYDKWAIVPHLG